ncbi:MAG: DUF1810 domain-containing protein [Bacteroidales bacterium]|nr:DUF1810 domain-containing protein [Bacteroidales bacterium]
MACFFKEALTLKNVHLPRSFVDLLNGSGINYDIERFFSAQDSEPDSYNDALRKIKQGKMQGLWIGYIFPQIKGLGYSYRSEFYGISGKEEAKAYLEHPELGKRLREITMALLNCSNSSAENILGFPSVLKVKSCMTLFDLISPNDIFNEVLDKYYEGKRCDKTIWRLGIYEHKLKNQVKLSRLTITKDYSFILSDYNNKEVKMEPLAKAVYLLFLNHPEGIVFKCLPNYKEELITLYSKIKPCSFNDKTVKSIEDITNPLLNSINEKCSRIKAAFLTIVDISLADQYYITGKSGEPKKITLPRDLVNFQGF